jgi:hypothetical protein
MRVRCRVDGREVVVSVVDAPDLEAARRRIFGFVLRGDIGEACGPDGPVILNWRAARTVEVLGTEGESGG